MNKDYIIRASEIGQYIYCARAWWLGRVQGLAPATTEELALGRDFHSRHGQVVARSLRLSRWALILLGLAALCLMTALLLWKGGR